MNSKERRGHYLGTEIDEKWWRRYRKKPFFARGNGTFSYDDEAFYFLKYPADRPLVIPLEKIVELKIGKWHAGRWGAGMSILKIIWENEGSRLSSGFLLSGMRGNDPLLSLDTFVQKLTAHRPSSLYPTRTSSSTRESSDSAPSP